MRLRFEHDGTDFSAYDAAEKFLRSHGYDVGSMQRGAPTGFMRNADVSKWRNMSRQEREELDGYILGTRDFRSGPVQVVFQREPSFVVDTVAGCRVNLKGGR